MHIEGQPECWLVPCCDWKLAIFLPQRIVSRSDLSDKGVTSCESSPQVFTFLYHVLQAYVAMGGGTLWQANGQLIRLSLIVHVRQA